MMKNILESLIKDGLIREEKGIGFDQITSRLGRAARDLRNARLILPEDEIGAYTTAYDSMLQSGIALILSYDYRPKVVGFHKTIILCAKKILGNDFSVLIKRFDQMRRNRHEAIYDVGIISVSEAKEAIKTAEKFNKEIKKHIKDKNLQKSLI